MAKRPFTARAQNAIALADENAARLGHEYIGTEHLLLGLLEEKTGPAAVVLSEMGVTVERIMRIWLLPTGTKR